MDEKETTSTHDWTAVLDDRTRKHVAFARHYAENFSHGAPGHLDLLTIATLASFLDRCAAQPSAGE